MARVCAFLKLKIFMRRTLNALNIYSFFKKNVYAKENLFDSSISYGIPLLFWAGIWQRAQVSIKFLIIGKHANFSHFAEVGVSLSLLTIYIIGKEWMVNSYDWWIFDQRIVEEKMGASCFFYSCISEKIENFFARKIRIPRLSLKNKSISARNHATFLGA